MAQRGESDPYAGFIMNASLDGADNVLQSDGYCVTPYYSIDIGGVWTWYCGGSTGRTPRLNIVRQGGGVTTYTNQSQLNLSWNIGNALRMVMVQTDLDDCWIKDSVGNYLFKGRNVIEGGVVDYQRVSECWHSERSAA